MMTSEDVRRLELPKLTKEQARRVTNAENTCRNSMTDWAKEYWYNVFFKLCKKYDCLDYFRRISH